MSCRSRPQVPSLSKGLRLCGKRRCKITKKNRNVKIFFSGGGMPDDEKPAGAEACCTVKGRAEGWQKSVFRLSSGSGRNGQVRYFGGQFGYFCGSILAFSEKRPYIGGQLTVGSLWPTKPVRKADGCRRSTEEKEFFDILRRLVNSAPWEER